MNNEFRSPTGEYVSSETVLELKDELPALGEGGSRRVFALGDNHVLKVAHLVSSNGAANLAEAGFWEKVKDTPDAEHFAEVFACAPDGAWLVMERMAEVGSYAWGSTFDVDDDTYDAVYDLGVRDLAEFNWGRTAEGKLKVVDYACHRQTIDNTDKGE